LTDQRRPPIAIAMTSLPLPFSQARLIFRWLLIIGVACSLGVVVSLLLNAHIEFGYDFQSYWSAAQRAQMGQTPYAPHMLSGSVDAIGTDHYRYPPPLALVLSALVPLGRAWGLWIWTAVSAAVLIAALEGVRRLATDRRVRIWFWPAVILFIPTTMAMLEGNVTPLLAACFAAILIGAKTNRPLLTGLGWGLGALLKLEPGLLAVWLLRRRAWAALGLGLATIVIVSALSLIWPAGIVGWRDYPTALLSMLSGSSAYVQNATPASLLQLSLPALREISTLLMIIQAMAAVALVWMTANRSIAASFMLASAAAVLMGPPIWAHSLLVLLPAGLYLYDADPQVRPWLGAAFTCASLGIFFSPLLLLGISLAIVAGLRSNSNDSPTVAA